MDGGTVEALDSLLEVFEGGAEEEALCQTGVIWLLQ